MNVKYKKLILYSLYVLLFLKICLKNYLQYVPLSSHETGEETICQLKMKN